MNRSEAWHDLGGNDSDPNDESLKAMFRAGLITERDRRYNRARALVDAEQYAVNKVGAALVREAGIKPGTDRDSVEFRLKQIREERNRTRRS